MSAAEQWESYFDAAGAGAPWHWGMVLKRRRSQGVGETPQLILA
jgi:hypothetical protein